MNVSIFVVILLLLWINSEISADDSYVCSHEKNIEEQSNRCAENQWSPLISAAKTKGPLICCARRDIVCVRIKEVITFDMTFIFSINKLSLNQ